VRGRQGQRPPEGWQTSDRGHLTIVTETRVQGLHYQQRREICDALTARFPGQLVLLEHWTAGDFDDHNHLDQVALEGRRPTWRRTWPTTPANPDHNAYQAWMQAYGQHLLAVSSHGR
jgi:hypothetical protein